MTRYIFITLISLAYIFIGSPLWMLDGSLGYWERALVYQFLHANAFHLAVNCLALWSLLAEGGRKSICHLIVGLVIGFLVYGLSNQPLLGVSNAIFAMVGLRTPPFSSSYWKQKNVWIFLGVNALLILVPRVSAVTHLVSFGVGVAMAYMVRMCTSAVQSYNNVRRDVKRIVH